MSVYGCPCVRVNSRKAFKLRLFEVLASLMCSNFIWALAHPSLFIYDSLQQQLARLTPTEQTAIRTGHKMPKEKQAHRVEGENQRNVRLNTTLLLFMTPVDEKPNAKRLKADKIYLIAPICSTTRHPHHQPATNIWTLLPVCVCAQWAKEQFGMMKSFGCSDWNFVGY